MNRLIQTISLTLAILLSSGCALMNPIKGVLGFDFGREDAIELIAQVGLQEGENPAELTAIANQIFDLVEEQGMTKEFWDIVQRRLKEIQDGADWKTVLKHAADELGIDIPGDIIDPPPPPPPGERYPLQSVYRVDLPKIISMAALGDVPYASFANVYHGGNKSKIYRGSAAVYSGSQETLTVWTNDGQLWATPEHGSNLLRLDGDQWVSGPATKGRWSVAGFEDLAAFNNNYSGGTMKDAPVLLNVDTGAISTIPATTMPRDIIRGVNGELLVSCNFGKKVMAVSQSGGTWLIYPSPALSIATFQGKVYGAGSMGAGPAGEKKPDGSIYEWIGLDKWEKIYDTGAYSVPDILVLADRVLFICVDPDMLYEMTGNPPVFRRVFERGSDFSERDRSFGGAGCVTDEDTLYVGWSDKANFSEVYSCPLPALTP